MTRAVMANAILNSFEANQYLMANFYMTYLRRRPGPGETNGWVGALQQGLSQQQVIALLLSSGEYLNSF
jgi:hypothetical protein